MKEYSFSYRWQFESVSAPEDLWPLLSDTNRLFKDMNQPAIQKASLSHEKKKGFNELTYEQLHRMDIWEEQPYQWEFPYHISVKRDYKTGYYKNLLFSTDISRINQSSKVTISFSGVANGITGYFFVKKELSGKIKRRLKKIISEYDSAISEKRLPSLKSIGFKFGHHKKWEHLKNELAEISSDSILSEHLINFLHTADELDLNKISPVHLARLWKKTTHSVLELMLYAAKIGILNYSWDLTCPECRNHLSSTNRLSEITEPLFCNECNEDVYLDFNQTIYLVFHPHPLVRKLSKKRYCLGNPGLKPYIKLHQYLYPGQKKFVKISLKEGNYRLGCEQIDARVDAIVNSKGIDNATIKFQDGEIGVESANLSHHPNLILENNTDHPIYVYCEDRDNMFREISASRATSLQLFRNLFPQELIRPGKKIAARGQTVLFTDLINSSHLYHTNGDDLAIGQVMDHFEQLSNIITEERGAIVKTIGDAVMAVFPNPFCAVKAFHRAQKFFKEQRPSERPIQLKGGIHHGDCVAVTLNNRIDYFGTTINIASRLVEHARGGELVISSDAYKCSELREFIKEKRTKIKIHHFDLSLKGFEGRTFEAKRISLQSAPLRLVV